MSQQLVLDYVFADATSAIAFVTDVATSGDSVRVSVAGSTSDPARNISEQWFVRVEGPLSLGKFADPAGFVAPGQAPPS